MTLADHVGAPTHPRATDAWASSLDALEALLLRQQDFIDGFGPMPGSPWVAPDDALPATLRPRALALAATCAEVEARLQGMLRTHAPRAVSPYR